MNRKQVSNTTSLKVCPSKNVCPSTIPRGNVTEIERERDRETDREKDRERDREMHKLTTMKTAELGLWEGLSHSASLCSISLRLIVIVLKVVAAKTNWREK